MHTDKKKKEQSNMTSAMFVDVFINVFASFNCKSYLYSFSMSEIYLVILFLGKKFM